MTGRLLFTFPSLVLLLACGGATSELEDNAAGASGNAGQSGVAGNTGGSVPRAGTSAGGALSGSGPGGALSGGAGGLVSEAGASGSVAGSAPKGGSGCCSPGGAGSGGVPSAGRSGGPSGGVTAVAGRSNEAGAGGSGGATTDPRCPATSPSLSSSQPAELVLVCPPGITCMYSGINRCLCRLESSGYCAQVDPTCGSMSAAAPDFRALPAGGNTGAPPPRAQACTCNVSGWSCMPAL